MELAKEDNAEKVELVTLHSMSDEELDQQISVLQLDIANMTETLRKMKSIHSEVNEEAKKEEVCNCQVAKQLLCQNWEQIAVDFVVDGITWNCMELHGITCFHV